MQSSIPPLSISPDTFALSVVVAVVNMDQYQFHAHGELFIRTLAAVLSTDAETCLKQGFPCKHTAPFNMCNVQPDDSQTAFNYV